MMSCICTILLFLIIFHIMYTRPNMLHIIILHQHTLLSEPISTQSINHCMHSQSHLWAHWPWVVSRPPPLPQELRCPFYPFCWQTWCVCAGPLRQNPHQTEPGPPGQAALGWALQEALGCHSNYLRKNKDTVKRKKTIFYILHRFLEKIHLNKKKNYIWGDLKTQNCKIQTASNKLTIESLHLIFFFWTF